MAVFVSPHLDDVVFSCGASVALDASPRVVTVFARPPDPDQPLTRLARLLHVHWGSKPVDALWRDRIAEDLAALVVLDATAVHLPYLDALYRDGSRDSVAALTSGELTAADRALVDEIAAELAGHAASELYFPLGVGRHVDHVLVHEVGRRLERDGAPVRYYAEFPYAATAGALAARLAALPALRVETIDVTAGLERRIAAMGCYRSQLRSVFGTADVDAITRAHAVLESGRFGERFYHPVR